jgi:hypothetical protein
MHCFGHSQRAIATCNLDAGAVAHGWLTMHQSGAYLMFTQAEAELFA